MTFPTLRWLTLAAAAALSACGGSSDPTASTEAKSSVSSSALDTSQNNTSINTVDATVQASTPQKRSGVEPFAAVTVDNKALRKSGASVDLGAPAAADLAQLEKNNKKTVGRAKPHAHQTGFARTVTATSQTKSFQQLLTWSTTSTGAQRASIRLNSTGAKALRVGLQVQSLPDDAVLRVYADGSSQAQQTTGAFVKSAIAGNVAADGDSDNARTYWMPSTLGEATVLEVDLPAGRDTSTVSLAIPKVMHLVQNAMEADLSLLQAKSACPNLTPDATCTLPPAVNAVTVMDFVEAGVPYSCSGTLVANRGTTQQGYVLTANHCISTQTAATSVVSYWFYRSSACNSTTINPNWTSVSGGATLRYNKSEYSSYYVNSNSQVVVTSDGTDTSLIDLVGSPPVGAMYAGWAFQRHNINTGTNYVGLHHPKGSLMRRSDGVLSNYFVFALDSQGGEVGDVWTDDKYPMYEVDWTTGITEGGSSGSGLFHDGTTSNPKIIGQLWGGFSGCGLPAPDNGDPNGNDYYGRFDLAYENGLINWLNPGYSMVFRFYNTSNGAHFFSANVTERDTVRATVPNLLYEAPAFMVSPVAGTGLSPVYRFMNRATGVHFYTINESEKNAVLANASFNFEGIAWYARQASSPATGTIEVYRFLRRASGTHLYTVNVAERDNIIANRSAEYAYEGVAYLAWGAN